MTQLDQALLWAVRCTVGESFDLTAGPAALYHAFQNRGRYNVANLGPDPVYVRMFQSITYTMTTGEMQLLPSGSGDNVIPITIGLTTDVPANANNMGEMIRGPYVLHYITAAGDSATLRVTQMFKK